MFRSLLLFTTLTSLSCGVTAQTYHLGEDFDPERYKAVPKVAPLSRGSFDELPSRVSLVSYAPQIGNQKGSGSCVGWASTYSAASIAWALTVEQSGGRLPKSGPFSPAFVFNRVKLSPNCEGGSYIDKALDDLTGNGTLPLSAFPYSDKQCQRTPSYAEFREAKQYAIEGYRRLSSVNSTRSLHIAVRRALAQGHPVVIGMLVGESFMKYNPAYSTWQATAQEEALYDRIGRRAMYQQNGYGGHAMSVVGYDDDRDGGAFHIMNSWGNDWGDRGFAWVKYRDFIRWVNSAYEVVPQIAEAPEPEVPDFNGRVVLKGFRQTDLPLTQKSSGFGLQSALHSGARLRAEVTVSDDSYVYVIGTDAATARHTVLFPQQGQVSPLVSAGDTILLPGPTEDYYSRLDQTAGTDYLIVLHSREKLDVNTLAQQMDANGSRDLRQRLTVATKGRLVAMDKTELANAGRYKAIMGNEGILATVIDIEHRGQSVGNADKAGPEIVIISPEVENTDAYVDGDKLVRYVSGDEVLVKGLAQDESEITEVEITNGFDIKFSSRGPFVARVDLTDVPVGSNKTLTVRSRDQYNNESSKTMTILRVQP